MDMKRAIALSAGNKAKALHTEGQTVVVQIHYREIREKLFHVWHLTHGETRQSDGQLMLLEHVLAEANITPNGDYWEPV